MTNAGARCNKMPANTSKFRPQAQTKGRSTVYGALPEGHDRHENRLLKYEDLSRVQTKEIDRNSLPARRRSSPVHAEPFRRTSRGVRPDLARGGDEDLPGALGAREVQGGLAQADEDEVIDGSFALDSILPDLQK